MYEHRMDLIIHAMQYTLLDVSYATRDGIEKEKSRKID